MEAQGAQLQEQAAEVMNLRIQLGTKFKEVASNVGQVQQSVANLSQHVDQSMADMNQKVASATSEVSSMKTDLSALRSSMDDKFSQVLSLLGGRKELPPVGQDARPRPVDTPMQAPDEPHADLAAVDAEQDMDWHFSDASNSLFPRENNLMVYNFPEDIEETGADLMRMAVDLTTKVCVPPALFSLPMDQREIAAFRGIFRVVRVGRMAEGKRPRPVRITFTKPEKVRAVRLQARSLANSVFQGISFDADLTPAQRQARKEQQAAIDDAKAKDIRWRWSLNDPTKLEFPSMSRIYSGQATYPATDMAHQ